MIDRMAAIAQIKAISNPLAISLTSVSAGCSGVMVIRLGSVVVISDLLVVSLLMRVALSTLGVVS